MDRQDDHDELSITGTDGRWTWELLGRSRVDDRTYAVAIAQQITTRQRWRAEYEVAKAARAGPAPTGSGVSLAIDNAYEGSVVSDGEEEASHVRPGAEAPLGPVSGSLSRP
jgi:hypothetical protein